MTSLRLLTPQPNSTFSIFGPSFQGWLRALCYHVYTVCHINNVVALAFRVRVTCVAAIYLLANIDCSQVQLNTSGYNIFTLLT